MGKVLEKIGKAGAACYSASGVCSCRCLGGGFLLGDGDIGGKSNSDSGASWHPASEPVWKTDSENIRGFAADFRGFNRDDHFRYRCSKRRKNPELWNAGSLCCGSA